MNKKIVYVGAGVSTQYGVLHLLKNGYDPSQIVIIEKGDSIYNRKSNEVMSGAGGAGTYSDFKVLQSWTQGGIFTPDYVNQETADKLGKLVEGYIHEYHPDPTKIMYTTPEEIPQWLKDSPFDLKQSPCFHLGTDYGRQQVQNIFEFFDEMGVIQLYNTEVTDIDFHDKIVYFKELYSNGNHKGNKSFINYDKIVLAGGKSGVDFLDKLIKKYNLKTKPRAAQLGVRYETDGKYFEELTQFAYDFKLYKKWDNISGRSFCLPPGEKILIMRNNKIQYENIECININDKVLTYNVENKITEFINPINTTQREYNGYIYNINDGELRTTEDHEIFCLENEKSKKEGIVKKGQNKGKKWWNYVNNLTKINLIPSKNLKVGDRILRPSNFNDYLNKNEKFNINELGNEFYYMLGLWLSDGSASYNKDKQNRLGNSISIVNEKSVLEEVTCFLKSKWIHTNIRDYENYSVLNFNSKYFINYLQDNKLFTKGLNRGLPNSIFSLSKEEIFSLLSGLIDGDGRVKKEHNISIDYYTSSELLLRDLTYLLSLLNIKYTVQKRRHVKTNFIDDVSNYCINICDRDSINLLKSNLKLKNYNKKSILLLENNLNDFNIKNYQKVFNIEKEKYNGMVYDLTIPNTHNFIAGRIPLVIHNCVNNYAAFVAPETTYGKISFNGHAHKDPNKFNGLCNFGIMLEIKDEIEQPFEFKQNLVSFFNKDGKSASYSPINRLPSKTDDGEEMPCYSTTLEHFKEGYGKYANIILEYIDDLNKTFNINDNYIIYLPEVKYISNTILFNNNDFSLIDYPDVHIQGDNGMSRGIWIAACSGLYVAEKFLEG